MMWCLLPKAIYFNENGNAHTIYTFHNVFNTSYILTMSDQVSQLKSQIKSSQVTEGTFGFKAASNLQRSGFDISDDKHNF